MNKLLIKFHFTRTYIQGKVFKKENDIGNVLNTRINPK